MFVMTTALAGNAADEPLLKRSTVIHKVSGWSGYILNTPHYLWLNSKEILYFREGSDDWRGSYILDVATGKSRELKALGNLLRDSSSGFMDLRASPDGQMLMFLGSVRNKPLWMLSTLDARRVRRWPSQGTFSSHHSIETWSFLEWNPDGKTCIESTVDRSGTYAGATIRSFMRDVTGRSTVRKLPPVRLPMTSSSGSFWPPVFRGNPMRALAIDTMNQGSGVWNKIKLFSWDGLSNRPVVSSRIISMPPGWELFELRHSPDGKSIVWGMMTQEQYAIIKPSVLERSRSTGKLAIWISRSDGTGMKQVGFIPVEPGREKWVYEHFGGLEWRPDGKAVSFTYNGELRLLPVSD